MLYCVQYNFFDVRSSYILPSFSFCCCCRSYYYWFILVLWVGDILVVIKDTDIILFFFLAGSNGNSGTEAFAEFTFNSSLASLHTYLGGMKLLFSFYLLIYILSIQVNSIWSTVILISPVVTCYRGWGCSSQNGFLGWWCHPEPSCILSWRYSFVYASSFCFMHQLHRFECHNLIRIVTKYPSLIFEVYV